MSVDFPDLEGVLTKLVGYCDRNQWSGHDPYDALNSHWLDFLPFLDEKWSRLALTQLLKRSPINLRPLFRIPPSENPKALGLFLSAFVQLDRFDWLDTRKQIDYLVRRLESLSSGSEGKLGWGYNFPWQTRTVLVKRGAPNLVCTVFVTNALLDVYELTGAENCLRMATAAAEFIADDLFWQNGNVAGFSYPTSETRTQVHNANLLGAALLCRSTRHINRPRFIERALKVACYSAAMQAEDGSWLYGEAPTQAWVDNFHTGFNLTALRSIGENVGTSEFDEYIRKGFDYYLKHFITNEGVARYFHDRTYPIDIHCIAQALLTLTEFRHLTKNSMPLASQVYLWAIENMWSEDGFFYYRKLRNWTIRTPFMRWSEAWMVLALASVLTAVRQDSGKP